MGRGCMRFVPFTLDAKLQLYCCCPKIIMEKSHQHSHLLQDGTVARLRYEGFWTVRCRHLAKKVVDKCVNCRKVTHRLLTQRMGEIQEDLFGPFLCRGDVNPRSKKTWAMIIEDCNAGAVHLDVVTNYSAQAVISSLHSFASLRGVICTDPGSQLESSRGQLEKLEIRESLHLNCERV